MSDRENETLSDKSIVLLSKVTEALFKHLFLVSMNIKSLCNFFLKALILKCYSTHHLSLVPIHCQSSVFPEDMHNF